MNVEVRVEYADDVFEPNDVHNLPPVVGSRDLAAASWILPRRAGHEGVGDALGAVLEAAGSSGADARFWLLVGDSAWQPDSRIVRHHGLWKRLRARGLALDGDGEHLEERIDGGGGLKFFGAMAFSMDSVTSVVKVLHEESTACVALLPSRIDPRGFLRAGWRGDRPFDERLLKGIASTGGVMCAAVGRFDDPEQGVVGIGGRCRVRELLGDRAAKASDGT